MGERLRAIRRERHLTLAQVAERSGVSVATLSKVERGLTALGYDRFTRLANGLGVDIAELFAEGRALEPGLVATATTGEAVRHVTGNYEIEMLFPEIWGKAMTPLFATIRPDQSMRLDQFVRHPGQEFVHVLSGEIVLQFEGRAAVRLRAGESAYFDSARGHLYTPGGSGAARVLAVCVGWGPDGRSLSEPGPGPS